MDNAELFQSEKDITEAIANFDRSLGEAITEEPGIAIGPVNLRFDMCHLVLADPTGWTIPEHQHPVFQLMYPVKGKFMTYIDQTQNTFTVGDDTICIVPPSTLHKQTFGTEEKNLYISLSFSLSKRQPAGRTVCRLLPEKITRSGCRFQLSACLRELLDTLVQKCCTARQNPGNLAVQLLKSFLLLLLDEIFPDIRQSDSEEPPRTNAELVEFIRHRTANRLNSSHPPVAFVARCCHLSGRHINRIFKAATGKTITGYWRERKIEVARELLLSTNLPIGEIGRSLGFRRPGLFCDFFQHNLHVSPSEFRNRGNHSDKD